MFNKIKQEWLFLFIIFFISVVSFFHIADFWSLTNYSPFNYLTAIATEFFLIASIIAIRFTNWGWIMFVIGLIAQGFGNVYASYTKINGASFLFIKYKELTEPIYNWIVVNPTDATFMRSLALITGLFYVIGQSAAFRTYTKVRDKRLSDEADALFEAEMEVEKTENNKLKEINDKITGDLEETRHNYEKLIVGYKILSEVNVELEILKVAFLQQKEKIDELSEEVQHQQSEKMDVVDELLRTRNGKQESENELKEHIKQLYSVIGKLSPLNKNDVHAVVDSKKEIILVESINTVQELTENGVGLQVGDTVIFPQDSDKKKFVVSEELIGFDGRKIPITHFNENDLTDYFEENPTQDNYNKDITEVEEVLVLNKNEIDTIQHEIKENIGLNVEDLTTYVYDTLNTTDGIVENKQIEYTKSVKKSVLKKER